MRPSTIALFALACIAMLHTAGADSQNEVLTPSEIAANPDQFDGKHVRVKGYVVIAPHARNIFDSKNGHRKPDGTCLGLYGSESFVHTLRKKMEIVSGVFRKALCGPDDICLYWCSSSGIEVDH